MSMVSKLNVDMNALQNIKTPDDMAQFLLNSGKVSQAQVNQAKQMWNNPQVQQQINSRY
jgi:hypothetical protein